MINEEQEEKELKELQEEVDSFVCGLYGLIDREVDIIENGI